MADEETRKMWRDRNKNYWQRNPEKYEAFKEKMKAYAQTEKGKAARKRAKENLLKKDPDYYKRKSREWKTEKRMAGLCITCGKRKPESPYNVTCDSCINRSMSNYEKWKEKDAKA